MQILFLGTSGSWPTPKRNVSAVAVKRGPEVLLFDCGEGTQRQFMLSPMSFMQVSRIFVTHFHGDHFLGIPGLVQSMTMGDRHAPLEMYGPRGMKELAHRMLTLGHFKAGFEVPVRELSGGESVDFGEYVVRALDAQHTVPALSYALEEKERPGRFDLEKARALGIPEGPLYRRLQEGQPIAVDGRTFTPDLVLGPPRRGRKIVYTGDTMTSEALVAFSREADVLIHDATAESSLEEKANRYGHSTARQAALVAKDAGVRRLVLTHVSPRYEDGAPILADAAPVFPNTVLAEDFLMLDVPYSE
ncbi:MAG TPA: ribonuclease Z [Thermoplasmata archaeon]|jgi:ribonuclease Z|nr:ribonuclease Z [Thermoplasmata archaeon]